MSISIVILAAGSGSRMKSSKPKLLHLLGGKPILQHLLETCSSIGADQLILVHGKNASALQAVSEPFPVSFVEQSQPLGTGDAVRAALPILNSNNIVVVLVGDVPLLETETIQALVTACPPKGLSLIVNRVSEPHGFGRILRDSDGQIKGIVEERDASPEERTIQEINAGIFAVRGDLLTAFLPALSNVNAQQEFYFTDIIGYAVKHKMPIEEVSPLYSEEVLGINTQKELARIERCYQSKQADALLAQGVQLLDPDRIDIRGRVVAGKDVLIDINTVFEGEVVLADGVQIGSHCVIKNTVLGAGTIVAPFTHLEGVKIGEDCRIGPYARIRPGVDLQQGVRVGNFVEIKNASVGIKTKINHLSYVGDAHIGQEVNVGAGTITCNYDGVSKHQTSIGPGAFIGSHTTLVAPVSVGENAFIGAGTVLTKDAPPDRLTLGRVKQQTVPQWRRPTEKTESQSERSTTK